MAKATSKQATKKTAKKTVDYKIDEGDAAPNIPKHSKRVVLYFYPKDNTPGCTLEGYDFKKLYKDFKKVGYEVVGVSADSEKSHAKFKDKCGFPFELLSDEDKKLCKAFDVIQQKSMFGVKYEGIERSTFVIDGSGKIARAWRKVKVLGHAKEVLGFIKDQEK